MGELDLLKSASKVLAFSITQGEGRTDWNKGENQHPEGLAWKGGTTREPCYVGSVVCPKTGRTEGEESFTPTWSLMSLRGGFPNSRDSNHRKEG